jgi:serine/threonine protein kinase/WD40 repeat protein
MNPQEPNHSDTDPLRHPDQSHPGTGSFGGSSWLVESDAGEPVPESTVVEPEESEPITPRRAKLKGQITQMTLPAGTRDAAADREFEAAGEDYDVRREVASGGLGVIHLATQTALQRDVAVKALKSSATSPELLLSEAFITAQLDHPNIVPIYDLAVDDRGRLFYVMKYFGAENDRTSTWAARIRTNTLEENIRILKSVCDAVGYAHSRGVINRDLKPANVMVGDFGEVIVVDWGLAVCRPDLAQQTSKLRRFKNAEKRGSGTLACMAPEMLTGRMEEITFAADIYLLGAILFEILEGRALHALPQLPETEPERTELLKRAVLENRRGEEQLANRGPLMKVALKATSRSPLDRHQSVREFITEVEQNIETEEARRVLEDAHRSADGQYGKYQTAVAQFSDVVRKFTENEEAKSGANEARRAFAELALRRNDFDLGLEVLEDAPELSSLRQQLERKRTLYAVIRRTWFVTSFAAVVLLVGLFIAGYTVKNLTEQATNLDNANKAQQTEIDSQKKEIASNRDTINGLNDEKDRLARENSTKAEEVEGLTAAIAISQDLLGIKQDELAIKQLELTGLNDSLKSERMVVEELKVESLRLQAESEMLKTEAGQLKAEASQLKSEASQLKADSDRLKVDRALAKLNAKVDLGEWQEIIDEGERQLRELTNNPQFRIEHRKAIEAKIESAKRESGQASSNSRRDFPDGRFRGAEVSAMTPDGALFASIARDGDGAILQVIRPSNLLDSDSAAHPEVLRLPPLGPGVFVSKLSISPKANAICGLTSSGPLLWTDSGNGFSLCQLPAGMQRLMPADALLASGFCSFTFDGRHLFLAGGDRRTTVCVLRLERSGSVSLLVPAAKPDTATTLFLDGGETGKDTTCTQFAVMPDGSGVLHYSGRDDLRLRYFPIAELETGRPRFPVHADEGVDSILTSELNCPFANGELRLLQLVQDGSLLLGLQGSGEHAMVLLRRRADGGAGKFPFVPRALTASQWFRGREPLLPRLVQVSADGRMIAAVLDRGRNNIEVWDASGEEIRAASISGIRPQSNAGAAEGGRFGTIVSGQSARSIAIGIAPGDQRILFTADRNSLTRWNLDEWETLKARTTGIVEEFRTATADQQQAASGLRSARKFGAAILTSAPIAAQPPDGGQSDTAVVSPEIYSAEFSPDGERVLIGTNELEARILDRGTLKATKERLNNREDPLRDYSGSFHEGHKSNTTTVRFVPPDGRLLLTSENLGVISVWDAVADADGIGRERSRLMTRLGTGAFAVSADGSLILAAGAELLTQADGTQELVYQAKVWRTADTETSLAPEPFRRLTVPAEQAEVIAGFRARGMRPSFQITSVAVSADNLLAVAGGRRGELVIWSLADERILGFTKTHSGDQVSGMAFDRDGNLITAGYDGRIYRWPRGSLAPELSRPQLLYQGQQLLQLEMSPDRSLLAICDLRPSLDDASRTIRPKRLSVLLEVSVVDIEGSVRKRLLSSPVLETQRSLPYQTGLAWSFGEGGNGDRLMVVYDGLMTLYRTSDWSAEKTLTVLRTGLREQPAQTRAAFSPADRNVIATLSRRQAHLWNLDEAAHLAEFRAHHSQQLVASWSADGRRILTVSDALRMFDADPQSPNRGRTLLRIPVERGELSPLEFARFRPGAEPLQFLAGNRDGDVWLYRCTADGELDGEPRKFPPPNTADWPQWESVLPRRFQSVARWSSDGKLAALTHGGGIFCWRVDEREIVPVPITLPEDSADFRFHDVLLTGAGDSVVLAGAGLAKRSPQVAADDGNQPVQTLTVAALFWKLDPSGNFVPAARLLDTEGRHSVDAPGEYWGGITAMAVNPQLELVWTAGDDADFQKWTLPELGSASIDAIWVGRTTGKSVEVSGASRGRAVALQLNAGGSLLYANSGGRVIIVEP